MIFRRRCSTGRKGPTSARAGLTNIAFEQGDAQVHALGRQASTPWSVASARCSSANPVAAYTNILRALRPGGTLAVLSWRELAETSGWLRSAGTSRWADVARATAGCSGAVCTHRRERVRRILAAAGFVDVQFESVDDFVDLGWLLRRSRAFGVVGTMGLVRSLTDDLDEAARIRALAGLHEALASTKRRRGPTPRLGLVDPASTPGPR